MISIKNKHYKHIKVLGEGAQGQVRLIEDTETQNKYALKIYSDIVPEKSIEREIEILTKRSHPHILKIIDCGRIENSFYTISSFAPGGSLDTYIEKGELTLNQRLMILRDALLGLEFLHNDNIIHRDIKPANIFIESGEQLKGFLGDFGLAKARDDSLMDYSECGGMVGTAPFLTPEYLRNETRVFDAKADLYAIGVSLYKCVTGYYPYGDTEQELLDNLNNPKYKPPVIRKYITYAPKELQDICERALAIHKEERFATARQFIMNIESLLEEENLEIPCPKPGELTLHITEHNRYSEKRSIKRPGTHLKYKRRKSLEEEKTLQYMLLAIAGCTVLGVGYITYQYLQEPQLTEKEKKAILIESYLEKANKYYKGSKKGVKDIKKAFEFYKKAALLGNSDAQSTIGLMYFAGEGVLVNQEMAVSWIRKAAINGNVEAMINLGDFYSHGTGVKKDYRRALRWYDKAIKIGNYERVNVVGYAYIKGEIVEKDIQRGIQYYLKGASQSKGSGYFGLAELYRTGDGLEQDDLKAIEFYQKAIEQGNELALMSIARLYGEKQKFTEAEKYYNKAITKHVTNARVELGLLYLFGHFGSQMQQKGLSMCQDAAKNGEVIAQAQLGEIYRKGIPGIIQVNEQQATEWFVKAAEQGSAEAAYKAAMLYGQSSVVYNPMKMIEYLRKGIDLNHPVCMVSLGVLLRQGVNIQKDSSQALKLFMQAAELEEADAYVELGHLYIEGDGQSKNIEKAIEYYAKGAQVKHPVAHFMLGQIYDSNLSKAFNRTPQYTKAIYHYQQGAQLGYTMSRSMLVNLYNRLIHSTNIQEQMPSILDDLVTMNDQGDGVSAALLGNVYFQGLQGVKKNYLKALKYYDVADHKNIQGIHGYYGSMYLLGKGIKRDYKKAYQLFQKGALYNDPYSLYYLGVMYQKGIYVQKNKEKSRELLKKSGVYNK